MQRCNPAVSSALRNPSVAPRTVLPSIGHRDNIKMPKVGSRGVRIPTPFIREAEGAARCPPAFVLAPSGGVNYSRRIWLGIPALPLARPILAKTITGRL
jgi:hypothetical protein